MKVELSILNKTEVREIVKAEVLKAENRILHNLSGGRYNQAIKDIIEAARAQSPGTKLDTTASVGALGLSQATHNCLRNDGIETIGDLTERCEASLFKLRNFGKVKFKEIQRELERHGLSLKSG